MESHAKEHMPRFVMMAQFTNDTLDVVCHWHVEPTEAEMDEMVGVYIVDNGGVEGIVRFVLSDVTSAITVPHGN